MRAMQSEMHKSNTWWRHLTQVQNTWSINILCVHLVTRHTFIETKQSVICILLCVYILYDETSNCFISRSFKELTFRENSFALTSYRGRLAKHFRLLCINSLVNVNFYKYAIIWLFLLVLDCGHLKNMFLKIHLN